MDSEVDSEVVYNIRGTRPIEGNKTKPESDSEVDSEVGGLRGSSETPETDTGMRRDRADGDAEEPPGGGLGAL